MGLFDAIDVAGTGLAAERVRMDVTSQNLANAQTAGYRRRDVQLASGGFAGELDRQMGVQVTGIVQDAAPNKLVYDPGSPDANAQGYVSMPNIDTVTEMVDLITASRAYEADVTAMQTAKQMFSKSLDLLR